MNLLSACLNWEWENPEITKHVWFLWNTDENTDSNPQTLLFSATLPHWVHATAKKYLRASRRHFDLVCDDVVKTSTTVTVSVADVCHKVELFFQRIHHSFHIWWLILCSSNACVFPSVLRHYVWLGGQVVRILDLRSIGLGFESLPIHYRVQPWASCWHICASVTNQYKLVPANGRWCLAAGKVTLTVGLASHWPCVTSGSQPMGSSPRRPRWAPTYALLVEYGELYFFSLWHCWLGDRKGVRPVKKAGCWFVGDDSMTAALHVL